MPAVNTLVVTSETFGTVREFWCSHQRNQRSGNFLQIPPEVEWSLSQQSLKSAGFRVGGVGFRCLGVLWCRVQGLGFRGSGSLPKAHAGEKLFRCA